MAGVHYTRDTTILLQGVDALDASDTSTALAPATAVESTLSNWAVFGQVDYDLIPPFDVALGRIIEATAQHSQTMDFQFVFYGSGVDPRSR